MIFLGGELSGVCPKTYCATGGLGGEHFWKWKSRNNRMIFAFNPLANNLATKLYYRTSSINSALLYSAIATASQIVWGNKAHHWPIFSEHYWALAVPQTLRAKSKRFGEAELRDGHGQLWYQLRD